MRISDWSSDVCSSDLVGLDQAAALPDLQQVAHRLDAVLALGQVQFLRRQQLFERSERVLAVELAIGRIPHFALALGPSAILEATTAGDFLYPCLPQDHVRPCRRPASLYHGSASSRC